MYNILIIEDDRTAQMLLAELSDRAIRELRIYRAPDLSEAVDILEKEEIDLMFINGRIAAEMIRKNPEMKKNTPEKKKDTIMLSTATGVCPVAIDTILAIERTQRNFLNVYTAKRILKEVRGTLAEISKPLPDDFVFINRQCIINRTAITRIIPKTREVFLDIGSNEITFSCSRDKIRDIITWFNSFNSI